jgi:Sperm tail/Ubiquitin family
MVRLLVVTPAGDSIVLDVDLSDDVRVLQQKLQQNVKFNVQLVRLGFAAKQLTAGNTLNAYGIVEGSSVQLLGRLRGGAQLGKVVKGRSQVKKKDAKPREYADLQAKYAKMQEVDAARQQAQNAKQELRRRMELEERNSRTNRLKIQNQWRKIMRLAKVESLRRDIEILSQNHERDVDRKDAIIQMLDRDLEEAEDQYQMALRAHLHSMDELIDLQDSRLLVLEQRFEAELVALEEEFSAERAAISAQHSSEERELQDIMAAVDAQVQHQYHSNIAPALTRWLICDSMRVEDTLAKMILYCH